MDTPPDDIVDCLKTVGLDGSLLAMDTDGLCVMEIDDFAPMVGQPWATMWPAESQGLVTEAVAKAARGKVARFSAECPTAKGTPKLWDVTVTPIRGDDGAIVALQSLSLDVTRRELDRSETLLVARELTHRLKNLLAMIEGMIQLSARGQPQAMPFVASLRERLAGIARAIAFIHPMGTGADSTPRSLQGLVRAVLEPYDAHDGKLGVTGDDVTADESVLTSLALVLNELATNAVKYGALRDGKGSLRVVIARDAESVRIDWIEAAEIALSAAGPAGFGTSLLDRTVQRQLSGTIARDWSSHGVTIAIGLPLDRLGGATPS